MKQFTEIAAIFGAAVGDRLQSAERLVLALADLFQQELHDVDIAYGVTSQFLVAIARFETRRYSQDLFQGFSFWAGRAGAKVLPIDALGQTERVAFMARVEHADIRLRAVAPANLPKAIAALSSVPGRVPDRRRFPRVRAQISIDLGAKGGRTASWDLSEGGVYLASDNPPPLGTQVEIDLVLPRSAQPHHVKARVAFIRPPAQAHEQAPAGFGLAFISPTSSLVSALARFCSESGMSPVAEGGRASRRHPAHLPTEITLRENPEAPPMPGTIRDISMDGTYVAVDPPPQLGAQVLVALQFRGMEPFAAPGRVVNVRRDGVGIRFTADPAADVLLARGITGLLTRARRALVVDDDELMRRMLGDALVQQGFEVLSAADGVSGLEVLLDELLELDLLLTDVHMPNMDGEVLINTIRSAGGEKELVIVAVTGGVDDAKRAGIVGAGVNAVIEKSIGAEAIVAQAIALLDAVPPKSG